MKVKQYIADCLSYSSKFGNNWDYWILCADAYLAGYKNSAAGSELVEFKDSANGQHMLSYEKFKKQKEDIFNMSMKELLATYIPMLDVNELRVEEKDGVISFQGTAKRFKLHE